jgi:AmmeMemoRadiSam system protein A
MSGEGPGSAAASLELNALERRTLLRAAREAIAARLNSQRASLPPIEGGLAAARGAFVTLRRAADGDLRGCVGRLEADTPLLVTVTHMAVAAAFRDGRFDPVSASELVSLRIEISVLSPLEPIRPSDIQVGRHGLLLRQGSRSGVLLPQVPEEHGWDREAFLAHTCLKAGLPPDTWRQPDAELLGFTATVFAEDD